MTRSRLSLPWLLAGIVGVPLLAIASLRGMPQSASDAPQPLSRTHDRAAQHYVTPGQLTSSAAVSDRTIAPFKAVAHDGREVSWEELSAGRAVVVVFLKRGCPCSAKLQAALQRVAEACQGAVRFIGVIDAEVADAAEYVRTSEVPFPVLADGDLAIIRNFGATHGGYVALVNPRGEVAALWPGFSGEMMQDLCRRITAVTGMSLSPLEFVELPGALTTGCPFAE